MRENDCRESSPSPEDGLSSRRLLTQPQRPCNLSVGHSAKLAEADQLAIMLGHRNERIEDPFGILHPASTSKPIVVATRKSHNGCEEKPCCAIPQRPARTNTCLDFHAVPPPTQRI